MVPAGLEAFRETAAEIRRLVIQVVHLVAILTGAAVTAEEHSILRGLRGAVAEILSERCPTYLRHVGLRGTFGESDPADALLEKCGLTACYMARAARELAASIRCSHSAASGAP